MDARQLENESWWSRPAGVREVLVLAMPMVASTLSWTLMQFIDRIILQHVSGEAMTAAFSATIIWFTMISLFWGICTYASTFVSQYYGDRQYDKIGPAAWQGVWLAVFFTPIVLALHPFASHFFAEHAPTLAALEVRFFQIMCWAAPAMLAAQSLEAFFSGQGRTRVVMCVDAAAVLVNLVLACVLVLGWGGIRSWGMDGAAWATVCAQWSRASFYLFLVLRPANRARFNTLNCRLDPKLIARLLRFGGPSGVQMLLDVGGFAIFVQMVGKLGIEANNATSLVFSISHFAFMPVWGLGMATAVLVGQKLGENRPDLAARAANTTLTLAMGFMGAISLLFWLTPEIFLTGFFSHANGDPQTQTAVRELSAELLRYVSAYNMFDAAIIIYVSVLRGAGDTRFVMLCSGCMATILGVGSYVGIELRHINIYAAWAFITVWVWALAVIYVLRYRQGRWRSMRVIDQVHKQQVVHAEGHDVWITDGEAEVEASTAAKSAPA